MVELDGVSIAYVSDHQEPVDGESIAPGVLELCAGADLVIHDAQFEPHEFAVKSDWGHCTVGYAVRVAAAAGARRLALFHHDPAHGDDTVDRLVAAWTGSLAQRSKPRLPLNVASNVVVVVSP